MITFIPICVSISSIFDKMRGVRDRATFEAGRKSFIAAIPFHAVAGQQGRSLTTSTKLRTVVDIVGPKSSS